MEVSSDLSRVDDPRTDPSGRDAYRASSASGVSGTSRRVPHAGEEIGNAQARTGGEPGRRAAAGIQQAPPPDSRARDDLVHARRTHPPAGGVHDSAEGDLVIGVEEEQR